jgi:hypothetical protein
MIGLGQMRSLRLISLLALAITAAGCGGGSGGGGTRSAPCTIYFRGGLSSEFYTVLRLPGPAQKTRAACPGFVRSMRQAGLHATLERGTEDYSGDVRLCALHARHREMDIYDSRSDPTGLLICKVMRRRIRFILEGSLS